MKSKIMKQSIFISIIFLSAQISAEGLTPTNNTTGQGLDCQPYPQCDLDRQEQVVPKSKTSKNETFWNKLMNELTLILNKEITKNTK